MWESGYYPPGAEFDPSAPYNEVAIPERDFDITATQTLSKKVTVTTDDYSLEVIDEPGNGIHEENCDTSDTNWDDVYAENDYHTPMQLINLFKKYLNYLLDNTTVVSLAPSYLKTLRDECENWEVEDTFFDEDDD